MRTWTQVLLCAVLTAALALCATASAEDTLYSANGGKLHFDKVSGAIMAAEKSVIKVVLPAEIQGSPVRSVADNAFSGCDKLTSVKLSGDIVSIGNGAFQGCAKLESADFPDSVSAIGDNAFSDCAALKSFRVPADAVSIGQEAFSGCAALKEIIIPEGLRSLGTLAFENCAKLKNIVVVDGAAFYRSLDGVLFNADATRIVCYPQGKSETSYHLPETAIYIGANAFRHCAKLQSVTIPDSVISIEDFAFFDCAALESLTIPDGAGAIGAGAFSFSGLQSVTIPDSVVSIGELAFSPCENLRDIHYAGTRQQWARLEDLSESPLVPDGVTIHYEGDAADFQVLSAPLTDGHAIRKADLQSLQEISVPVSVRTPARITLFVPFYDPDGRFVGMGFTTRDVDETTTSVTAPVAGDVSGAASVKVLLCAETRPAARARSYAIAD